MNATFALRGHPADYDGWDMPGWTFEDVLPAFVRLERDLDFGEAPHHGAGGPVPIRRYLGRSDPLSPPPSKRRSWRRVSRASPTTTPRGRWGCQRFR